MKKITPMALCALCLVTLVGQLTAQTWQAAGPASRWGHTAVLDTDSKSMVVFGGKVVGANLNPFANVNDVWRLNNNLSWTLLTPTGTLPAERNQHTAVYDSVNDRMIVFGGSEGNAAPCANDVWVLTNATGKTDTPQWLQLSPDGGPPAPRAQHGAAYDPNTNTMIVYGGQDCFSTTYGDVWILSNANGLGGTPTWTQLSPSGGGPGPRTINGGVAYDSTNNRLIVFGGSFAGSIHNDVWILSGANGQGGAPTWIALSPTGTAPEARTGNSTVYDPKSNRLIIVAGSDNVGPLHDEWALTNANGIGHAPGWIELSPIPSFFQARSSHTAVYDSKKNKMIIFGGSVVPGGVQTADDVWVLDDANGK